jgi:hypothetical protein
LFTCPLSEARIFVFLGRGREKESNSNIVESMGRTMPEIQESIKSFIHSRKGNKMGFMSLLLMETLVLCRNMHKIAELEREK